MIYPQVRAFILTSQQAGMSVTAALTDSQTVAVQEVSSDGDLAILEEASVVSFSGAAEAMPDQAETENGLQMAVTASPRKASVKRNRRIRKS